MNRGKVGVGEVHQSARPAIAKGDQLANDLVSGALGDTATDQVFHQGGGVKEPFVESAGDMLGPQCGPFLYLLVMF